MLKEKNVWKTIFICTISITLIISGCGLYGNPVNQIAEAKRIGEHFKGKSKDELISKFPNTSVDEIGNNEFRYTVRFNVDYTLAESLAAGKYRTPNTYIEIWFFSNKDGIIHRYDLRRFSR